jgi:hypothetical protein
MAKVNGLTLARSVDVKLDILNNAIKPHAGKDIAIRVRLDRGVLYLELYRTGAAPIVR